jgi:2-phospho-L-lactate guanylyltransferase
MARDSAAAAAQRMPSGLVFVVAGDARVAEWAAELGAVVVADPGNGLNAAVAAGIARAARPTPEDLDSGHRDSHDLDAGDLDAEGLDAGSPVPVAVLLGDVPALRPGDLAAGLGAAAAYDLAFVPDADGTGTVLLTALDAGRLRPRFGAGSARRHEDGGHRRLDLPLPRLRTDVDDAGSLARAAALGLGPRTAALLAGARRPTG